MIHSYFPSTIRSNTSLMRLIAVKHIIQVQVMDSRWAVGLIFICMIIAIKPPHQALAFHIPMVKIKVGIARL